MCINEDKTKAKTFRRSVQSDELTFSIHGTQVDYVQNFIYLRSIISWNNDYTVHIIRRIQLATVPQSTQASELPYILAYKLICI